MDGHLAENGGQASRSGRARACLPSGIYPVLDSALGSAIPPFGPVRLDRSGQPSRQVPVQWPFGITCQSEDMGEVLHQGPPGYCGLL
jgi:hypothetical protein